METHKRVEEWARQMEYKGKIPDSLKNICGPSTAHIWEQLIANVKPKREIQHIKNNIIVRKLKEGEGRSDGAIKEIQSFERREQLKSEIVRLQSDISEKTEELEGLERKIGSKNVILENLRGKIRETKRKTFLYRNKSEQLERDVPAVQGKLDFAISVTPTEGERNDLEISETLRKCAEKIKQAVENEDATLPVTGGASVYVEKTARWDATIIGEYECFTSIFSPGTIVGLDDEEFSRNIKTVLCGNNFDVISGMFSKVTQECKMKLADAVSEKNFSMPHDRDNSEALSALYTADIENNLLAIKYDMEIRELSEELNNMKKEIFIKLGSLNLPGDETEALWEVFSLQLKEAGLSVTVDEVKKMLSASTDHDRVTQELDNVRSRCVEVHKKLETSIYKINSMLTFYKHVYRSIGLCQSETRRLLEHLCLITEDLGWLAPLTQNLNAKEVRVFRQFDLGYNRVANLRESKVFLRNILGDTVNVSAVDQSCLQMIRTLMGRTDESPEEVFFDLLQAKRRLNAYQVSTAMNTVKYRKHSTDDFEYREACVNNLLVRLEGTLKGYVRTTSKHNLSCMEKAMRLWLEMPVREFVSPQRMFDGQNFSYYQKIYDNMYNKL